MTYVNRLKTNNLKNSARERIISFANRLIQRTEVEAVIFMGGLANTPYRNFIDRYSDVDISVFLSFPELGDEDALDKYQIDRKIPLWLPNFEFHIPWDIDDDLIEINVYQQIIEHEMKTDIKWDEGKKEAYAYSAEVFFDRNGRVSKLIDEKIKFDDEYRTNRLALLLGQYKWIIGTNPLRAIERGLIENGHDLLNFGIELFLEGIYLYNRRYRPHPKWRLAMSFDLPWLPNNYRELIQESMCIYDFDDKDILRRRESLMALAKALESKVQEENIIDGDPYDYACVFSHPDRQLRPETAADAAIREIKFTTTPSEKNKSLLKGLINEYLITNINEIKNISKDELHQKYQGLYVDLLQDIV